ncbi:MAG: TetR/AcrR family transcriptional regulator [Alphaproteobacteria bacterium]
MRTSREQTVQTRERIITTASRLFRERGINGIGVADLMHDAGLTHGGFYKHFESKQALIAAACTSALALTQAELANKTAGARDQDAFFGRRPLPSTIPFSTSSR